jgi:hypothetical protein
MGKRALILRDNLQHNVPAALQEATGSLRALARVYFVTEVAGQAPGTIDAKRRDLSRFLAFYTHLYGHDRPAEWYASVTREFVREMVREKLSEATCARTYASIRHFARWIHPEGASFPARLPHRRHQAAAGSRARMEGALADRRAPAHPGRAPILAFDKLPSP